MGENISDVDLERFLRRRDRISREYLALGSEGPAAALDARVLEEARAALEQDASASGWRRRRWPTITALAATVLLSLGLIVRVALESDQEIYAPPPALAPATAPAPEADQAANDTFSTSQSAAEQPYAPPVRTPDPTPPERQLPRPQIEAEIRTGGERAKLAAPASQPVEAQAQSRERLEDKRRDATVPEAGVMKEEAFGMEQQSEVAPAAPATVAEPAPAAKAPAPAAKEALGGFALKKDAAGLARGTASQPMIKNGSTADEARMRDPEAWLDEIDKLRAAGRTEEADRELARFLMAYPRYLEEHPRAPTR